MTGEAQTTASGSGNSSNDLRTVDSSSLRCLQNITVSSDLRRTSLPLPAPCPLPQPLLPLPACVHGCVEDDEEEGDEEVEDEPYVDHLDVRCGG